MLVVLAILDFSKPTDFNPALNLLSNHIFYNCAQCLTDASSSDTLASLSYYGCRKTFPCLSSLLTRHDDTQYFILYYNDYDCMLFPHDWYADKSNNCLTSGCVPWCLTSRCVPWCLTSRCVPWCLTSHCVPHQPLCASPAVVCLGASPAVVCLGASPAVVCLGV